MNKSSITAIAAISLTMTTNAAEISNTSYSNDFSSSASDFTTSAATSNPDIGWVLDTGGSGFFGHNDVANSIGTYTASVQHSLLGGSASDASGFNYSSTVTYTATGVTSGNQLGVSFLASTDTLAPETSYLLYIRGTQSGGFSIFLNRNEVAVDSEGSFSSELRDFFDDTITFSVSGIYIDTNEDTISDALSISATVYNSTKDLTFNLSYLDSDPLIGNHFGMVDADLAAAQTFNAQWDSFELHVIPEPSSFALVFGLGALAWTARRKR